jgi:hypothetical protein
MNQQEFEQKTNQVSALYEDIKTSIHASTSPIPADQKEQGKALDLLSKLRDEACEALKQTVVSNLDISDRFEQLQSTNINKLFWIAGCNEHSSELKEMLTYDMDAKDVKECFPSLPIEVFDEDFDEILNQLFNHRYLGFLAEIHIPECSDFRFKGAEPTGCRVHPGISTVEYCYAETPELLMAAIEAKSNQEYEEQWKRELKKKKEEGKKK